MAGVFKPTYRDKKTGKTKKTAKWYGFYTDGNGKKHRIPLCRDKGGALKMLADHLARLDRQAAGLTDNFTQHHARPLSEHLADWEAALCAAARPTKQAQIQAHMTAGRCRRVMQACEFARIGDITADKVKQVIADFRSTSKRKPGTRSSQTLNYYVRSCRQFCRWLVRSRRTPEHRLEFLEGWDPNVDRRHERRALELEEIHWLLNTTKASAWVYRGLTGNDRFLLYATALSTGLRVSELATVTPRDFDLDGSDGSPPVVVVAAAYTKNGELATQPLPADLVPVLREYLATRSAGQPVWAGTWSERAYRSIKKDLVAARAAWIKDAETKPAGLVAKELARREASDFLCYRDHDGRCADFHSLRHTFITNLSRSGVSPKLAQELARHSDINLTMGIYTHLSLRDWAAALRDMPSILPSEKPKEGKQSAG
jgi:integrase/recombinase XerD